MAGGSRLSTMLAALQASGFAGASAAGALAGEASRPPPSDSASPNGGVTRRRSQRLSAKKTGQPKDAEGGAEGQAADGGDAAQPAGALESPEAAPSETVVDDDFGADFTDDEVDVDAEVIDDEGDAEVPDKTVNVSVGDGKS